ncbi:MAG: hypothetical protein KDH15_16520 [Rhodocyclaceae bacterium]|nr:hypothetical protein [Rhodocyclaceae bacterium]
MANNAIFFAWNRPVPGRERLSQAHFGEFGTYLEGLQRDGTIESFDVALLDPHGGDLNGFFLIRGEPSKLDALQNSEAWQTHVTRAMIHLLGAGTIRATTRGEIASRMARWAGLLPD